MLDYIKSQLETLKQRWQNNKAELVIDFLAPTIVIILIIWANKYLNL